MQTPIRLVCAAILASAALDAATIAYWRFEEGSGLVAHDSSGNGNHGTLIGGAVFSSNVPWNPVPQTGAPNLYSLQLNGSDAAVSAPDSPTLRPGTGFTVEAMINTKNPSLGWVIFGKQFHSGTNNSVALEIKGGSLIFQLTNASNQPSFVSIAAPTEKDVWHHVAGEWDGSNMMLFLDGILVRSAPFSGPIGWDINPVLIGADNDATLGGGPRCCWFNGLIDEVRLSDYALPPGDFTSMPEPSSLCLLGSGILFFVARFRGRRSRSQ